MENRPRKKRPTDYPQLAFRIKAEDKDGIMAFVDDLQKLANESLNTNEKRIKKNELLVDAIWLGLLQLKKKYRHLKKLNLEADSSPNETPTTDNLDKVEAS